MKKILSFFYILVCFSTTAYSVEIRDVPPHHWAYKSIQKLIQRGYLAVYDDKTFRGELPVSRVIFASVIGKLIDDIEVGRIKVAVGDLKEIRKLGMEFRDELSDYQTKLASVDKRIAETEKTKVVIQKDLSKMVYDFRSADGKIINTISENQRITEEMLKSLEGKFTEELKKSEQRRKNRERMLWIGIIVSLLVGI